MLTPLEAALGWLAEYALNDAGFVSYQDSTGRGLANQGWKDSFDSVQFGDGRLAKAPISLCEVQGYAYAAARQGADLLDAFGRPGGERWREWAAALAERFRERFWVDDAGGSYPAIALDGSGRPVDTVTSNIGHLLGTGLLSAAEAERVVSRLGASDLDCGHGLRTMSSNAAGFNPISYHGGSVWPHDTAIALNGLANTPGTRGRRRRRQPDPRAAHRVARIRLPAARTVRGRRGSTRCAPGALPGVLPASGVVGRVRDRGALDRARLAAGCSERCAATGPDAAVTGW